MPEYTLYGSALQYQCLLSSLLLLRLGTAISCVCCAILILVDYASFYFTVIATNVPDTDPSTTDCAQLAFYIVTIVQCKVSITIVFDRLHGKLLYVDVPVL